MQGFWSKMARAGQGAEPVPGRLRPVRRAWPTASSEAWTCTGSRPSTSSTAACTSTPASPTRPATRRPTPSGPASRGWSSGPPGRRRRGRPSASRGRRRWAAPAHASRTMVEKGYIILGTPTTRSPSSCTSWPCRLNIGHLLMLCHFGNMAQGPRHLQHRARGHEGPARDQRPLRGRVGGQVVAPADPVRRAVGGGVRRREPLTWPSPPASCRSTAASSSSREAGDGPVVGYLHGMVGTPPSTRSSTRSPPRGSASSRRACPGSAARRPRRPAQRVRLGGGDERGDRPRRARRSAGRGVLGGGDARPRGRRRAPRGVLRPRAHRPVRAVRPRRPRHRPLRHDPVEPAQPAHLRRRHHRQLLRRRRHHARRRARRARHRPVRHPHVGRRAHLAHPRPRARHPHPPRLDAGDARVGLARRGGARRRTPTGSPPCSRHVAGRHVIDDAGHLAELDRPDEVAAVVAAALR